MTNNDKMWSMERAQVDAARSHAIKERSRRGLSARKAAELGGVTNTVWSKFEAGGNITPGVRKAVAAAFGWPQSWPERLPELSPELTDLQQITRRLDIIETLLRAVVDGQTSGLDALRALIEERLPVAAGSAPLPEAGS